MKNLVVLVACVFFSFSFLYSNAPDTLWTRWYGGKSLEMTYNVCETSDGGFISCGVTYSFSSGRDIYVIRMDQNGDTLWTKILGDTALNESVISMEKTVDGGYILCGARYQPDNANDVYLLKIGSEGEFEWETTPGKYKVSESGAWAVQTPDNGYIVAAGFSNGALGGAGMVIYKTDATGNPTDSAIYDWVYADRPSAIVTSHDGGYVLAGETNSFEPHKMETYLLKVDANLDSVWMKLHGDNGVLDERMKHVSRTSDNGFLMVGAQGQFEDATNAHNYFIVKTDQNGDAQWTKIYGNPYHEVGFYGEELASGGYIIGGSGVPDGGGSMDAYIMKLDESGDTIWTGHYGTPAFDEGLCVKHVSTGGYIIAGDTPFYENNQCYFIRLAEDVTEVKASESDIFSISASPNPFSHLTFISYHLAEAENVKIDVYNSIGRKIITLVDEYQDEGFHSTTFEGGNLPQGLYYYTIRIGESIEREKMMYIK